jgi:hypothetical protein
MRLGDYAGAARSLARTMVIYRAIGSRLGSLSRSSGSAACGG